MELIRVFANPRRSMQRVGFLKHLLWRASQSSTNNLSNLGKDLISSVSQKVSVSLTPQLQKYIKSVLVGTSFADLRAAALRYLNSTSTGQEVRLELQDFYLSDQSLSSCRGRLGSDDWHRYPHLALGLGFLRKGTYSLLVRGQSFLSLMSEDEKKAFVITSGNAFMNKRTNPFLLNIQQKILLLFSFIERDSDVLCRLYKKLLQLKGPFADKEAGDYLPEAYRDIAKEARPKTRNRDESLRVEALLDTAGKIEALRGKPSPGGKNPREHAITIRLEPYVDIGLLSKPDPFAGRYEISDEARNFFRSITAAEKIEHFLESNFFSATNEALNINKVHRSVKNAVLYFIQKAYNTLKSPLGYAPILEVSLLAGIYSILETDSFFEISESKSILMALQKENPEVVRFNVDRLGSLALVKFNGDIVVTLDS